MSAEGSKLQAPGKTPNAQFRVYRQPTPETSSITLFYIRKSNQSIYPFSISLRSNPGRHNQAKFTGEIPQQNPTHPPPDFGFCPAGAYPTLNSCKHTTEMANPLCQLQNLPIELILAIMKSLPDYSSLLSLLQTSRIFSRVFASAKPQVLMAILSHIFHPKPVPEALAVR